MNNVLIHATNYSAYNLIYDFYWKNFRTYQHKGDNVNSGAVIFKLHTTLATPRTKSCSWRQRVKTKVVLNLKNIISVQRCNARVSSWFGKFNLCGFSSILSITNFVHFIPLYTRVQIGLLTNFLLFIYRYMNWLPGKHLKNPSKYPAKWTLCQE